MLAATHIFEHYTAILELVICDTKPTMTFPLQQLFVLLYCLYLTH
jgi:hypothetical protein